LAFVLIVLVHTHVLSFLIIFSAERLRSAERKVNFEAFIEMTDESSTRLAERSMSASRNSNRNIQYSVDVVSDDSQMHMPSSITSRTVFLHSPSRPKEPEPLSDAALQQVAMVSQMPPSHSLAARRLVPFSVNSMRFVRCCCFAKSTLNTIAHCSPVNVVRNLSTEHSRPSTSASPEIMKASSSSPMSHRSTSSFLLSVCLMLMLHIVQCVEASSAAECALADPCCFSCLASSNRCCRWRVGVSSGKWSKGESQWQQGSGQSWKRKKAWNHP
jgi:hypothetical protein